MGVASKRTGRGLRRLTRADDGGVALVFGLGLPVLFALTGLAVDTASFYNQQSRMQNVADEAALAIAKEMHLFVDRESALEEFGESRVETLLAEVGLAERPYSTDVSADAEDGRANVSITMATNPFLPVEMWGENPIIVVNAEASTYGGEPLCVLGLHESSGDTIKADAAALITAPECAIQSNSTDSQGLTAGPLSTLVSSFTCTSGGYAGLPTSFVPPPETDCPAIEDPLSERAPPAVGGCDYLNFVTDEGVRTIQPGHYCGGLKVTGDADVVPAPGIYVVSGGKLEVSGEATFHGENVGFYFADDAATLIFKDKANVELSAPKDGLMAGMLMLENPAAAAGRNFEIKSASVHKLLGTIYLPRAIFKGDGRDLVTTVTNVLGGVGAVAGVNLGLPTIGEASAYTVIVANRLDVSGVNLVINADYAATDIPVPDGVGPNSGNVRLSE